MKPVVAKGKIIMENSNGGTCEMGFILPDEIMSEIFCDIIGWKDRWVMTPKNYEAYMEAQKEFTEKLKSDNPLPAGGIKEEK
jgi:hypothetical protein